MNITIYYLNKKIVIQELNHLTKNQDYVIIDKLDKKQLMSEFINFATHDEFNKLTFVTKNIEKSFDKFRKCFKLINAAGGLIEKDGAYLFIFRLKKWDLPKGKLDMGESPEEAAIRECEEECGISKLTITKALEPTFHIYPHKGAYAIKKTFWYAMQTLHEGALIPQLEEKIERVEYFTTDQIKTTVIPNSYPAILDVIIHCEGLNKKQVL